MSKKILVAYFSATGQTEKLAKTISEVTGGDLFEIKPPVPYTGEDLNWRNSGSRSSVEMNDKGCRPKIADKVSDMPEYDTVFVGFPIWWYEAPRIIQTFLESYDFSGKTVITFATSGSSDISKSDDILKQSCSDTTVFKAGKRMSPTESEQSVQKWVESLNL